MKPLLARTLVSCGAFVVLLASSGLGPLALGQIPGMEEAPSGPQGVLEHVEEEAFEGYTLFSPLTSQDTLLIDMEGQVVKRWESEFRTGQSVYLLDDGHLLRCGAEPGNQVFSGGGQGGRIEEFDWDGNLVWTYVHSSDETLHHHDIAPLPNGNVLLIAWERKTPEEALAAGRDADAAKAGMWPDTVIEVRPIRPEGGEIVWEWHLWDHLVQDRDPELPNYGVIAEHPERLDVNVLRPAPETKEEEMSEDEIAQLLALGYLGDGSEEGDAGPPPNISADWNHVNAIDYHPELDQMLLSSKNQHEIWIIDHSTTTEEAAGHTGGRWGRGGDFLYRWGNPATYHHGDTDDRKLGGQHHAHWIPTGLIGAGHILIFNNGANGEPRGNPGRRGQDADNWSAVIEIAPPLLETGYAFEAGVPYGPEEPTWSYTDPDGENAFYSFFISGAQRLPNDNTLICSGGQARVFEVTPEGETVWDFRNPFGGRSRAEPRGPGGPPPGSSPGEGRAGQRRGAPGAEDDPGPDRGPGAGRGPGGGPERGPMGGMQGLMFRATRIAPDHPALAGKALEPIDPEER